MIVCKVTGAVLSRGRFAAGGDGTLLVVHPIDTIGDLEGERDMLAFDPGYGAGLDDVVIVAKDGSLVSRFTDTLDADAEMIILGVVNDWSAEA